MKLKLYGGRVSSSRRKAKESAKKMKERTPKTKENTPQNKEYVLETKRNTPKPEARTSETKRSTPKPEARMSETKRSTPKSETHTSETKKSTPRPEARMSETKKSTPKSETHTPEMKKSTPKPEARTSETKRSTPKPEEQAPKTKKSIPRAKGQSPEVKKRGRNEKRHARKTKRSASNTRLREPLRITRFFVDVRVMTVRCLRKSTRNADALFSSVFNPVLMMLLFVFIFGGAMITGDTSYVNYIVPGIILQCIGQSVSTTAVSVSSDISQGIIDRFRAMPISQSSVLTGHVVESVLRNILTTFIVVAVALIIGFRPNAGILDWLTAIGLLALYSFALSWIAVVFALITKGPEGASGLSVIPIILTYISSGFVPTTTMPIILRPFAQYQPLTPIIDSVRALLTGTPVEGNLFMALMWCLVIFVVSFITAVWMYRKKIV